MKPWMTFWSVSFFFLFPCSSYSLSSFFPSATLTMQANYNHQLALPVAIRAQGLLTLHKACTRSGTFIPARHLNEANIFPSISLTNIWQRIISGLPLWTAPHLREQHCAISACGGRGAFSLQLLSPNLYQPCQRNNSLRNYETGREMKHKSENLDFIFNYLTKNTFVF